MTDIAPLDRQALRLPKSMRRRCASRPNVVTDHRIERYETVAPDGTVVEIVRDMVTGAQQTTWTDRRAFPLPVSAAA